MGKKSSTFEGNFALLMERFPRFALEIPAVDRDSLTKEEPAPTDLEGVEVFYFYGIGQGEGYFLALDWLKQKPERRLVLLEDDLERIASFLHAEGAKSILEDEQVVIGSPQDLQSFAEEFPVSRIEVGGLPSKGRLKKWKEELFRKTAFAHSLHLDRLHGYQPFQNFAKNLSRLPGSFYANRLRGKFEGVPAVICGAGPSLKEAIPILRTLENKALLIAGGSTLAALSSQGIMPHFGMAVDPNLEEYRRMKNSFTFEVPLLYSTRVFPAIFQTVNGPFGYMRSGIGGVPEVWIEEELGLLDPMIGTELSSDAISVTSICLAWAEFLGCNPILLSGVDLAYTSNQRYAPGVADETIDLNEKCAAADRIVKRKGHGGKPVYTAIRWLMESAAFSDFAAKHPKIQFLNTTEGGLGFRKIPFCPLEEAVRGFSHLPFSLRAKVHEEIAQAPMPSQTKETIEQKMQELQESLARIVGHLEILAGEKAGISPLAEIELGEEMAYPYLFFDALSVLEKEREDPSKKWLRFLQLAKRYQIVLRDFF